MIIVKITSGSGSWFVYHRSLGATQYINLNATFGASTSGGIWNNTEPTSSVFTLGNDGSVNSSGQTYVAYLFAHNAGGFGTSGTDNVISCGSYTGTGASGNNINLGYEPQWVMIKVTNTGNVGYYGWCMFDNMRGVVTNNNDNILVANSSGSENGAAQNPTYPYIDFTATGFNLDTGGSGQTNEAGNTYIYMAIRRPMAVPTVGTSVFAPFNTSVTSKPLSFNTNFPVDFALTRRSNGSDGQQITSRLQGGFYLNSGSTNAEDTASYFQFDSNTSISSTYYNTGFGSVQSMLAFRRASGFMDVVCYTGNGSSNTLAHNLTVAPELTIIKSRNNAFNWQGGSNFTGSNFVYSQISSDNAGTTFLYTTGVVFSAQPTASSIFLNSSGGSNSSGATYIAYLFATCPGVSKVGSYTGTGATQTIACGFTGGARFVLIKRIDSTGDWWFWDAARGMVTGTDPRLALNLNAAEVNNNWVFTTTGGFQIVTTDAAVNASGGSYIFLAVA
jgi:hypothetical protein